MGQAKSKSRGGDRDSETTMTCLGLAKSKSKSWSWSWSRDRKMKTTMTCQGKRAAASPLEDDDILPLILVRLPPLPTSLPRASAVCKRWRRLVTDPYFRRRFLAQHKKAPLLGFFYSNYDGRVCFVPTLDPPDHIHASRFSSRRQLGDGRHMILGCHHGRILLLKFFRGRKQHFVLWDPITGDHRRVDIPQVFMQHELVDWNGAVVCASRERDHVHGACHGEPFQVILTGSNGGGVFACVYSSDVGTWGSLIPRLRQMPDFRILYSIAPHESQSSLVGNSIYWLPMALNGAVLEFDLHTQTLAVIDAPPDAFTLLNAMSIHQEHQSFVVPADGDDGLSFIVLSGFSVFVWNRIKSNGHGVAEWVFKNTVELGSLLSLNPRDFGMNTHGALRIVGIDEDDNVIFRLRDNGVVYMVHLETLQFKQLSQTISDCPISHPFSSFYTTGMHPETGMQRRIGNA